MISVANEAATYEDKARDYFKEVVAHTRTLTDLPITAPRKQNSTRITSAPICLISFRSTDITAGITK